MEIFFTPVNILIAAIAGFIVGSLWYSPALFMNQYLEGEGLTKETMARRSKEYMWKMMSYSFLLHGVIAAALAIFLDVLEPASIQMALYGSILVSVGFIGATRFMDLLYSPIGTFNSGRNQKKFLVSALYYVVMIAVMAIVMYYVR